MRVTYVVTNQAKSGGLGVFLHDSSQRCLSVSSHGVSLVQDDQFDVEFTLGKRHLGFSKGFDDISNHIDSSSIGGIQFEHHESVVLSVHVLGAGHNCGGLSRSWGTVKEQIWQILFSDIFLD